MAYLAIMFFGWVLGILFLSNPNPNPNSLLIGRPLAYDGSSVFVSLFSVLSV
jgi:hypothetical protein